MSRVYEALDVLSGTGWSINTKMLYTIQRAWVQDMVIADIPPKDDVDLDGVCFVCVYIYTCIYIHTQTHTHTHGHCRHSSKG